MMFKERWAFVLLVFITSFVVYFMPLGEFLRKKCHCPKPECLKDPNVVPHDMIVITNDNLKNASFAQIKKKHGTSKQVVDQSFEFQRSGWVLDCISWEAKWESPTLDADPHGFTLDNIATHERTGETDEHREQMFVEVFKNKDRPANNDPSFDGLQVSGPGAMLRNAQGIIATLHVIVTKLKQHLGKTTISILDLACGDLQWMKRFLFTRNDVEYTGADIVPEIIDYHRRHNSNIQRVRFIHHDIVKSPLNESYDLILCRDVLQHLWKYDAMKALHHFSASKSKFLLATTYPDTSQNGDVEKDALGGRKFPYNLELPPFSLVPPVCSSYDWNTEHISLWTIPLKQKYEI